MQEYLYWLFIAIVFFAIEIFTFTTFFLFLGLAMLAMTLVVYVYPDLEYIHQATIFLLFTVAVLLVFYKINKNYKRKNQGKVNVSDRMSIYIGRNVEAISDSEMGITKVALGDTVWRARVSDNVHKGDKLKIVATDSTTVVCEKIS